MNGHPSVALVVNTFNQPEYLARVLKAVGHQAELPEEVLLADDGSGDATGDLFRQWAGERPFRCERIWQAHEGFRRARVLNMAIAAARAEYLVFLDGDTIPHPRFISDHRQLAQRQTFVQGHRALIEQKAASFFGLGDFARDRRRALLQGQISGLKNAFRWPAAWKRGRSDTRGIRGCNLGIWRADLVNINGYNEEFIGWGREDSELAIRLLNTSVARLDVRGWAACYHLWHAPASRAGLPANEDLLKRATDQHSTRCARGLDQHLHAPAA